MIAKSFGSAVKAFKPQIKGAIEKTRIENLVFRLHTKFTSFLIFIFFFVVCAREYFGEHIKCMNDKGIEQSIVNNYCFFMSTYTLATNDASHLQEGRIPHPGITSDLGTDNIVRHKYYQWVPFVLFFQCVCFYLPHLIWKKEEGGRMKTLVAYLEHARLARFNEAVFKVKDKEFPNKSALRKKVEVIGKDIMLRLQVSRSWSTCLITLEVVNLLHVIIQMVMTNKFLGGRFWSLGSDWLHYDRSNRNITDPLELRFPLVTKCIFNKFGPSGTIINYDVLCVMSLNVLYEKIYIIMWFWFLILLVLSVIAIIWRIATCLLYMRFPKLTQLIYRRVTPGRLSIDTVTFVVRRCLYADWLFLYYLAANIPGFLFEELFQQLYEEMKQKDAGSSDLSTDDERRLLTSPENKNNIDNNDYKKEINSS